MAKQAKETSKKKTTKKQTIKPMTPQEMQEFDDLYQYVKTEVMGYEEKMALSKYMAVRLKGLTKKQFIYKPDDKKREKVDYSYPLILTTFKYCYPEIVKASRTKKFADENHKFNYMLAIVESKMNDVYLKLKQIEQTEEIMQQSIKENADTEKYVHYFVPTERKKLSPELEALW